MIHKDMYNEDAPELSMATIAGIVITICALGFYLSSLADARAQRTQELIDCTVQRAQQEGYAGNPYSREAFDLFAPDCN